MTRVNFFHLAYRDTLLLPLINSLVNQAVAAKLDVLVLAANEGEAIAIHSGLDPLNGCGVSPAPLPTTVINCCWQEEPGHHRGFLINLRKNTPDWFSRFDQLAEFVWQEPQLVGHKRENYRLFRHHGYPLVYEELTDHNDLNRVNIRSTL